MIIDVEQFLEFIALNLEVQSLDFDLLLVLSDSTLDLLQVVFANRVFLLGYLEVQHFQHGLLTVGLLLLQFQHLLQSVV